MATPDHLFNLRNNFYLGAYQAAINSSEVHGLSEDDVVERDTLVHRCYIALGQLQFVVSEIHDSAPTPLQAVKLLALYFSSPDNKDSTISSLREWLADSAIGNNSTLRLVAGIIFLHENDFSEALKYTNAGGTMELHALNVQIFIKMHLFDLLCVEPERPWNLTVHFRGYPSNLLLPCEGEDSVKWSFINSLKEAAYVINGNCKNVMNMSQPDQVELWGSVLNGNLESYRRVSSKLKLGTFEDEHTENTNSASTKSQESTGDIDATGQVKTSRIPVRLYLWTVSEEFDDFEDAPQIDNWDKVSYINRPVELHKEDGKYFSLSDAVKRLLPEYFPGSSFGNEGDASIDQSAGEEGESSCNPAGSSCRTLEVAEIKLVRIQGIEPTLEIPFSWVVNNLMNPEYFLHMCVCLKVSEANAVQ